MVEPVLTAKEVRFADTTALGVEVVVVVLVVDVVVVTLAAVSKSTSSALFWSYAEVTPTDATFKPVQLEGDTVRSRTNDTTLVAMLSMTPTQPPSPSRVAYVTDEPETRYALTLEPEAAEVVRVIPATGKRVIILMGNVLLLAAAAARPADRTASMRTSASVRAALEMMLRTPITPNVLRRLRMTSTAISSSMVSARGRRLRVGMHITVSRSVGERHRSGL
jgi:hypothetical protein